MHYSAILVLVSPGDFDAGMRAVESSGLAEIHHHDRGSGRMIVVVESATHREQPEALERLRALPGVLIAELVYYVRDGQSETTVPSEGWCDQPHTS